MSKMFFFALVALIGTVTADVAHLNSSYLPPTPAATDHNFSTTIEKQELHELPTQIEYIMQDAHMAYNNNNAMAMSTPMSTPHDAMLPELPQQHAPAPVAHYLPPLQQQQQQQQQQMQMDSNRRAPAMPPRAYPSSMVQRPSAHMALEMPTQQPDATAPVRHSSEAVDSYYLAPSMEAALPQFNYRQFQQPQYEQKPQLPMPEEFMQQMLQYMRNAAAAEAAPQAPQEMEPAAAHTLAADGYHYRTNGDGRRFRTRL